MQEIRVIIIGAGIGGLAAALALQQSGFRPIVFESAADLGEVGAGLTMASNGSRILYHLGLGPCLEAHACIPAEGAVLHYRDGRRLVTNLRGRAMIERYGAPYCQIHRADLHAGLVAAVLANDGECLRPGHTFTDLETAGGVVRARFANNRVAEGDLLVGCDGIRSAVRQQLFGAGAPRFTGYAAWRGLVPMRDLPPGTVEPDSAIWIGPGNYVLRYPVRRGELLNYVAMARVDDWVEEGWTVPSTVEAVLAEFRNFEPRVQTILKATPEEECFRWGIFDRAPLARWSSGCATLLGDAAHPSTPFLGQGAVMALEDAIVLTRCLVDSQSVEEALARYEAARVERTAFIMRESAKTGARFTGMDPDSFAEGGRGNEDELGLAKYDAMTVPV